MRQGEDISYGGVTASQADTATGTHDGESHLAAQNKSEMERKWGISKAKGYIACRWLVEKGSARLKRWGVLVVGDNGLR